MGEFRRPRKHARQSGRHSGTVGRHRRSPTESSISALLGGLLAFSANRSTDCRGTPYINEVCTPLWTGDIGRERSGGRPGSTPAVANGIAYIGARSGILYAFNASNGSLLWTEATGGTIDSSAMIADGVVYVGCSSNLANQGQVCKANLYASNASNGTQLWTGTTGGSIDTSPIIDDGGSERGFAAVTVGAGDRVVFALPWTRKGESTSKPRRQAARLTGAVSAALGLGHHLNGSPLAGSHRALALGP